MTDATALVQHLNSDFSALHDAVLARMNGTASPAIEQALAHPALAEPIAAALAYAVVRARGAVRVAELGTCPADRVRPLRRAVERIATERAKAEAVCGPLRGPAQRASHRLRRSLEQTLARAVLPAAHRDALVTACAELGLHTDAFSVPHQRNGAWAQSRGLFGSVPSEAVRELAACDDTEFVAALLHDARTAEDERLGHHLIVERWNRLSATALARGRYAIATAERRAVSRPLHARRDVLDALEDAYEDLAVLACRAREAKYRAFRLTCQVRELTVTGKRASITAAAHRRAHELLQVSHPEELAEIAEAVRTHQVDCPFRADGCPDCQRVVLKGLSGRCQEAAGSRPEPTSPPQAADADASGPGVTYAYFGAEERYAVLSDIPGGARVVVSDAAIGEDSALCGYGWAAEDGTTGHGDSMASTSGEAEIIGVCAAALAALTTHADDELLVLCDSRQAVDAVQEVLEHGDVTRAQEVVLFPEAAELLTRLLPYAHRITVRWLKGHIGHDLNEAADALAGLALRQAGGRIAERTAHRARARTTFRIATRYQPRRSMPYTA
ncbi:RNase H family protein [Streptomyces sp. NPDC088674]|uniref:RNase H family protein n=1 Tax=Streptomyces sp. NPDC088674 TaxID=3365869 RepID=UPI00382EB9C6